MHRSGATGGRGAIGVAATTGSGTPLSRWRPAIERRQSGKTVDGDLFRGPNDAASLSSDIDTRIFVDRRSTIWLATWNGLDRFDLSPGVVPTSGPKRCIGRTINSRNSRVRSTASAPKWLREPGLVIVSARRAEGNWQAGGGDAVQAKSSRTAGLDGAARCSA
jgi:hypothetical protein